MELGKKIRQLRFKAGLTQEQLAERMGIGAQSVSKWENAVSMPDITSLPLLAEIFGVSIDDLFDLSTEQRLNRIENRMDMEEELPPDVFREYEDYLKSQLTSEAYRKRATELIAYLYWHRMKPQRRRCAAMPRKRYAVHPPKRDASGCCKWRKITLSGTGILPITPKQLIFTGSLWRKIPRADCPMLICLTI